MKRTRDVGGPRAGMSVVEVVVGLAIFSVLASSALVVNDSTWNASRAGMVITELDASSSRAMERVCARLRYANLGSMTPAGVQAPFSTGQMDFQQVTGYVGGAAVLASAERLQFQPSPSDPDDGLDNDGDGLVDEGRVVWVRDAGLPTQRTTVVCSSVAESLEGEVPGNGADDNGNGLIDEPGFCIDFDQDVINVRLTIERMTPDGVPVTRTAERSIRLRN